MTDPQMPGDVVPEEILEGKSHLWLESFPLKKTWAARDPCDPWQGRMQIIRLQPPTSPGTVALFESMV